MPTGHSANESNRTCIITLVHGTRPYGLFPWWHALFSAPPWFTKGSVFRSKLELELRRENISATFRIFQWSGNNSVFHRARAADELSSLLAFDSANANSIVIAHSHGGNVAFRAISKLGSRGASIHLVTLATPFFRAFPTWGEPSFTQLLIYFAYAISFGAYLLSLYFKNDVVVTFVAVSAVSAPLLVGRIINPTPSSAKRLSNRQTWAWRPFHIAEATNYDSVGPQAPNLLVIRAINDEAALALASGSIGTAFNRFVLRVLWNRLYVVLGIVLTVTFPVGLWRGGPTSIERWATVGFFVVMAGTCLCLLIPGLFKSPFGREFLIGASRCEIATESTPDSIRARIVTLNTPYQGPLTTSDWVEALLEWYRRLRGRQTSTSTALSLRHSIYNNPDCVLEIVKWLNEHSIAVPMMQDDD
jgi:hypothetical protein